MDHNQNENDKWLHAHSAEKMIEYKSKMAELQLMRELFTEKLPIGDNKSEIDAYLNSIEQIIESDGAIANEEFPEERRLIDPETGGQISYNYNSASLLKQRASRGPAIIGSPNSSFKLCERQSSPCRLASSRDVSNYKSVPCESKES